MSKCESIPIKEYQIFQGIRTTFVWADRQSACLGELLRFKVRLDATGNNRVLAE